MKKRGFTLLEIFIVLSILAATASIFLGGLSSLLETSRFHASCKRVKNELEKWQTWALFYQSDVRIEIVKDAKGVYSFIPHTVEQALQPWHQKKISLPGCTRVTWNKQERTSFHLDIFADGRIVPKGILGLFGSEERYLHIKSSPTLILSAFYDKPSTFDVYPQKPGPFPAKRF